MNQHTVVDHIK